MEKFTAPTITSELLHELIEINAELQMAHRFGTPEVKESASEWAAMNIANLNRVYGAATVRFAIEAIPPFDEAGL